MTTSAPTHRPLRGLAWAAALFLIFVVMVFFVIRVANDVDNLRNGLLPAEGEFDRRYAQYPVLAYLHIVPGVVYLLGAPFQLSARIRRRSIGVHRRLGRIVLPSGIVTGLLAIVVGIVMPFGGSAETSATVVFGLWFLAALLLAYRAIRAGNVTEHRRWMIRAFAVGAGVGMIRIVVGLFQALDLMSFEDAFGVAFWIAFVLMAVLAEVWLRVRPAPYG